ncbi:cell wall protein TIR4-like isoform X6 [Protopterus annectens]|uniref:cell wall protein TIR4-like isoform X6 n=1 Tax=Protopterus annectens TaxID=7888 RepID=UPI001CFA43F0|nr:cell wall protein TIR4-like isoform X6 [Protopterus annectens]
MEPFPAIILCLILFYCTLGTVTPDTSTLSSSSEAVNTTTQSGTVTPDTSTLSSSSEAVNTTTQSGSATPDTSSLSSSSDAVHSTTQSGTVTPDTSTLSSSSEAVNTTTQSVTAIHDNSTSSSEAVHSTTQSDKVKYSNTPADSTIVTSSKVSSNSTITANTGAESKAVEIPSKTDNQNHDSSSKMIWLPVIVISVFVIAAIAAILKTKCKPQTVNGEDADGDITASKPSGHDVKLVSVKRTSRDFDFLLPEYYLGSENGKFEDAIMNLENTQIV